ncbi:contractile injection system tape measure protein [Flavobacterium sp. UGB4466]|uniref:contractile injection system tape measure protein n=1 Tax=Flavobacterium sp. UGB4466 TaxID=2730889 RepID=UPI00192B9FE0|nr:contractile injection system tape measure protein [Flavobacterium sp. UGB4466]
MQHLGSHIINKLFLEVNTQSKEKAYYLKDHLDTFLKEELLPLLEAYFDTLHTQIPLYSIQIEKLDLDLSVAPELNFNALKLEILNQLQKQIEDQIQKGFPDTQRYKLINREEKNSDEFFIFLETGTSPWWVITSDNNYGNGNRKSNTPPGPEEDPQLQKNIGDKTFGSKLRNALKNSQIRTRFIKQLSDAQIYDILKKTLLLTADDKETATKIIEKIHRNMRKLVSKSKQGINQRNLIWEIVFSELLQHDETLTKEKLVQLIASFVSITQENLKIILEQIRQNVSDKSVLSVLSNLAPEITNIKALSEQIASDVLPESDKEEFLKLKFSETDRSPEVANKPQPDTKMEAQNREAQDLESGNKEKEKIHKVVDPDKKKKTEENRNPSSKSPETDDAETAEINTLLNRSKEIESKNEETKDLEDWHSALFPADGATSDVPSSHYVNNAGLILVHPFLKHLFGNCGLLHKDHTINDPETAAHLLHYIATDREQDYESQMLFEKMLCNIPINRPINRNIILSEELKDQGKEMLQAVLDNWPIMKNSSIALLQNEYLQRPGKIILSQDNPKVIVERKTQDILLDKISWNLGIVKLAWKDKIIFVDW